MSPPLSAPPCDNGSGFQRGFLLKKPITKVKGRPKSSNSLPSRTSGTSKTVETNVENKPTFTLFPTTATQPIQSKERSIKKGQSSPSTSGKKDLGWSKGFLTSKEERKPTSNQKPKKSNTKEPKASSLSAATSNKKDSGWSKGFLTNEGAAKKKGKKTKDGTYENSPETGSGQKLPQPAKGSETIRSSRNVLLEINHDDDNKGKNAGKLISQNNAQTIQTVTSKSKTLISVISNDSKNEPVPSSIDLQQDESTVDLTHSGIEDDAKGTTAEFTTKSLLTPLVSITRKEDKSSPVLITEVSTTRKLNHDRKNHIQVLDNRDEEPRSHLKHQIISKTGSADTSIRKEKQEQDTFPSLKTDGDGSCTYILDFQVELERLFSRPMKAPQHKKYGEQLDIDDETTTLNLFRVPGHRQCALNYILKERQQRRPFRQKIGRKKGRERNGCDYRIRALFDAEFFHHDGTSIDKESSLESVLGSLETESDRRLALEALLVVQEYFVVRYEQQEQDQQNKIQGSSRKSVLAHSQAKSIRRVTLLLVRLTHLALENHRTMLVQTAWETSILLVCFCIRESSRMQKFWSSDELRILCENLDSLLHQSLIWQEGKTNQNASKIAQLKDVRLKSEKILKDQLSTHQERLNSSLELVNELGKLIGL